MATIKNAVNFNFRLGSAPRTTPPPQTKTFERLTDARAWVAAVETEMRRGIFMDRSELERTTLQEALERYQEKEAQALKSKVSLNARIKIWLKHPLTFSARTILGKFDNGQHPP